MYNKVSWCIGKSYFADNFFHMCSDLSNSQRNYMKVRYIRLITNFDRSTKGATLVYYILSSMVTIGSIIVPSLIAIQDRAFNPNANVEEISKHSNTIYWMVWSVSITVTFSNAFVKLLRLDQKFISRNIRLNQLKSEGILFVTKTGEYSVEDVNNRFRVFVINIEKLKSLQLHQEFIQNPEFERNQPNGYFRTNEETMV